MFFFPDFETKPVFLIDDKEKHNLRAAPTDQLAELEFPLF
jgi:hypothetical protein